MSKPQVTHTTLFLKTNKQTTSLFAQIMCCDYLSICLFYLVCTPILFVFITHFVDEVSET